MASGAGMGADWRPVGGAACAGSRGSVDTGDAAAAATRERSKNLSSRGPQSGEAGELRPSGGSSS